MRITVRQAHDAHGAPGPVSNYLGEVIPVQIGELGYPAVLRAVKLIGDEVECTFDLLGAQLVWSVLGNDHQVTVHAGA